MPSSFGFYISVPSACSLGAFRLRTWIRECWVGVECRACAKRTMSRARVEDPWNPNSSCLLHSLVFLDCFFPCDGTPLPRQFPAFASLLYPGSFPLSHRSFTQAVSRFRIALSTHLPSHPADKPYVIYSTFGQRKGLAQEGHRFLHGNLRNHILSDF